MSRYTFTAYDLRTNARLGNLPQLSGCTYSERLNGDQELIGSIDIAERSRSGVRLGGKYRDMLRPGRTKIVVLRDGNPLPGSFIVWTRQRSGRMLRIRALGMWSYFWHRPLVNDKTYTDWDQHDIARDLIAYAQQAQGSIGLQVATNDSGRLRSESYPGYEEQPIAKLVEELASREDGFEFAVTTEMIEHVPTSTWRPFYPRRGRTAAANGLRFTLGPGGNLREYSLTENAPTTVMRSIGSGEGTSMLRAEAARADLLSAGVPLLEQSRSYKDVTKQTTLQAHANGDLRDVNDAATEWSLELVAPNDKSVAFGSWVVGDDALIVIPTDVDDFYPEGVELVQRIVGQTVRVPETGGEEQITLTMGAAWHP